MNRGARIVGLVFALALIGVWIWFSFGMASVTLDYPIRRAGESALYPARGTLAFYWGCTTKVSWVLLLTSFMWALPLALAIFLLLRSLSIRSVALRLLVMMTVLVGPVIVFSIYNILVVHTNPLAT